MLWNFVFLLVTVSCLVIWTSITWRKKRNRPELHQIKEVVLRDLGDPKLPFPIRGFNFLGKFLPSQRLTVEAVIEEAQRRTNLRICLDEEKYPFRDGLKKLVQDYNDHKNHLTAFGRLCLRNVFVKMISNNLRMAEQICHHPQILSESIAQPVFIIGPPRTGSSHLHDTLSQHPAFRTPKHLEMLNPVLKEDHFESTSADLRERRCNIYLRFAQYLRPHLSLLHNVDVHASEEDIFVTGILFRSIIFGTMFPCKGYMQWFGEVDHIPVYEFLKLALQVNPLDHFLIRSQIIALSLVAIAVARCAHGTSSPTLAAKVARSFVQSAQFDEDLPGRYHNPDTQGNECCPAILLESRWIHPRDFHQLD